MQTTNHPLQHTATHCNTPQHTATHCNTLQHTATHAAAGVHYIHIGWLRSVGSIKLQVSFADYGLFYRALLQKRPIILSILLAKATPYRQNLRLQCDSCVRKEETERKRDRQKQRSATHYNTLQHTTIHHTTLHYTTLQHTTIHYITLQHTTIHYTTLQHTTIHYTTLQHTTIHYTTLGIRKNANWCWISRCAIYIYMRNLCVYGNTLQHTATGCNRLQHTATHCNTLQRCW